MRKLKIRTCISCRNKIEQERLNRFQCIKKQIIAYSGIGRSFYICLDCLNQSKQLEKALYRHCKNKDEYIVQLKEILNNGR